MTVIALQRCAAICVAALLAGCTSQPPWQRGGLDVAIVAPFAETPPVGSAADAADDPAIWVHPTRPEQSLVLGTDKRSGLYVYDLEGREVSALPIGNLNNVDVRAVASQGKVRHFAAASNRTLNSISIFEIDPASRNVLLLGDIALEREPYGFCAGSFEAGVFNPVVTYKDGRVSVHRWRVSEPLEVATRVSTWQLASQLEGCAVHEETGTVFVGEEGKGVWRIAHDNGVESARALVDEISSGKGLVADVEGLDIWRGPAGTGYLVVSAQAGDRFVIYDVKPPHRVLGIIHVGPSDGGVIDGVSHTDGLTVSSAYLGPNLPLGLLVVQDDANTNPRQAQNFKLVDWQAVSEALDLD